MEDNYIFEPIPNYAEINYTRKGYKFYSWTNEGGKKISRLISQDDLNGG